MGLNIFAKMLFIYLFIIIRLLYLITAEWGKNKAIRASVGFKLL